MGYGTPPGKLEKLDMSPGTPKPPKPTMYGDTGGGRIPESAMQARVIKGFCMAGL